MMEISEFKRQFVRKFKDRYNHILPMPQTEADIPDYFKNVEKLQLRSSILSKKGQEMKERLKNASPSEVKGYIDEIRKLDEQKTHAELSIQNTLLNGVGAFVPE